MGSLTDLNTYSTNTFTVTDDRDPGPKFNLPAVFDLDFTESSVSFTVERQGVEVREIIRPSEADLYFVIDASGFPTVTVSLPSVPAGVTVTNPGGANVWFIGPINDVATWDLVKDPTITLPNEFNGNFFYNVQWRWQNRSGVTEFINYQVGLFIPIAALDVTAACLPSTAESRIRYSSVDLNAFGNSTASIQAAGLSSTVSNTNFFAGQSNLLSGHPEVVYAETTGTEVWTVEIEPTNPSQITGVTTYGTGGTVTFDSLTSVTTIEGTKDQVNSHLNSFYFTVNNSKLDFTFTYTASSDATGGYEDVRVQTANCRNNDIIDLPTTTIYHGGAGSTSLADIPNIYDIDYNLTGNYTYELEFLTPSDATTATTTGITRYWASDTVSSALNNNYGIDIAISQDGLYVAYCQSIRGTSGGFDFEIYKKVAGSWTRVDTVSSPRYRRQGATDGIGQMFFADDYTLVIEDTMYNTDLSGGSALGKIFIYEIGAGDQWTLAQTIGNSTDSFNLRSMSDDGDVLVATDNTTNQTPVRIYTRTGTGNYSLDASITQSTGSFGRLTVSGDGDTICYRMNNMDYPNYTDKVFFYRNIGGTWTNIQTLVEGVDYLPDRFQLNYDGSRLYYFNNGLKWLDETSGTWYRNETTYTISSTSTSNGTYTNDQDPLLIGRNQSDTILGVFKTATNGDGIVEIHKYLNGAWELVYDPTVNTASEGTARKRVKLSYDGNTLVLADNDPDVFYEFSYSPDPADFAAGVLTQTGTREEINQDLQTLEFTPAVDEQDIEVQITVTTPDSRSETIDFTIEYRLAEIDIASTINAQPNKTVEATINLSAEFSQTSSLINAVFAGANISSSFSISADLTQIYPYVMNAAIDRQYVYDDYQTSSVLGNASSAGELGDDPLAVPYIANDVTGFTSGNYYNAFITTSGGFIWTDYQSGVSGTTGTWINNPAFPMQEAGWVEANSFYVNDPNSAGNLSAGDSAYSGSFASKMYSVLFHPVHSTLNQSATSTRQNFTMRIQIYEYTTSSPTSGTSGLLISDTTVNLTYGGPA